MSDELLKSLLPALGMAAFERREDGSFAALAPPPAWFARLTSDATFPFLGHILEEAAQFWTRGASGRADFGPAAEVDASGREFHYIVSALVVGKTSILVFQLDTGSDRLREVLQKVRDNELGRETTLRARAALSSVQREVRERGEEMHEQLRRLLGTAPNDEQFKIWQGLSAQCDELMARVDKLARS
jgi:hypothetical protein